jgi:hypothetical protein
MDGWMDGWIYEWMDGWIDEWMDGWMDGCLSILTLKFLLPNIRKWQKTKVD